MTFDDSYVYYVSKIDVCRLPCFDPWMSYIGWNDGGATWRQKKFFLIYFAQVFCFEPLLLLRDSWCALMIDKKCCSSGFEMFSFFASLCQFVFKRSEFKQGFFPSFVSLYSLQPKWQDVVTPNCSCWHYSFFWYILQNQKTRCFYTFRILQGPNFLV